MWGDFNTQLYIRGHFRMNKDALKSRIEAGLVYFDGGTGTLLSSRGLRPEERPEEWTLTHPDQIQSLHAAYFSAGADIVKTNTFGANPIHYAEGELETLVREAVRLAKEARDENKKDGFVALDIGPLGVLLQPYGALSFDEAVEAFAKVVRIGRDAGADLILIETMTDSYETKAAVLAAKENSDLPVFVTNTYDAKGKLMTGANAEAMVALLEGLGVDAIGINCSTGPVEMLPTVQALCKYASIPVIVNPNAGLPRVDDAGNTVYDLSPEDFAMAIGEIVRAGARIIGGCCGTTPEFIRAAVERTQGLSPVPITKKSRSVISSYTHAVEIGTKRPILIGERINPTGKRLLKEALRTGDSDYILSLAEKQEREGAEVLDVNVGLPELDETQVLCDTVKAIQGVTDVPLQIDTGNYEAMERALRYYNGKALLNSVSGKEESMAAVFPLVKKYGGVVVALTLDENGIPETADGRVEIARRILARAKEYGLSETDLLFDPLTLTVSTDGNAPRVTLEAIRRIRTELRCNTSLGVSNVSFGLPSRDLLNGTFFALALSEGLNAAIINPASIEMQKTYHAYLALMGIDTDCSGYIAFAGQMEALHPAAIGASATPPAPQSDGAADTAARPSLTPLMAAIASGRAEKSAVEAERLGAEHGALSVIEKEIVPALDLVGKEFESGKRFLPQLLTSAEAAKSAFLALQKYLPSGGAEKGRVLLATVKGDVHDIGKNIVKVVLESYGFAVLDLGRDVSPEAIVDAVEKEKIRFVGLSALMTTTVPAMKETTVLLKEKLPHVRVAVGGAVLTAEYAHSIGADFYCKDALDAVRAAEQVLLGSEGGEK